MEDAAEVVLRASSDLEALATEVVDTLGGNDSNDGTGLGRRLGREGLVFDPAHLVANFLVRFSFGFHILLYSSLCLKCIF